MTTDRPATVYGEKLALKYWRELLRNWLSLSPVML